MYILFIYSSYIFDHQWEHNINITYYLYFTHFNYQPYVATYKALHTHFMIHNQAQSTVSDVCYASNSYRVFIIIFCVYYYIYIYIYIFFLLVAG